jgi:hypothetical protein
MDGLIKHTSFQNIQGMLDIVLGRTDLSPSFIVLRFCGLEVALTVLLIDCREETGCQGAVERIAVSRSQKSKLLIDGQEEHCQGNDD